MNYDNNTPIYSQLAMLMKIDMFSGKLKSGERLLSVRDLAVEFKVNPNTVQRAFNELEEEGLVFTERTNGRFVTKDNKLIERHRKQYAKELTKEYKKKMKEIGF